jgi:hypothetical protein
MVITNYETTRRATSWRLPVSDRWVPPPRGGWDRRDHLPGAEAPGYSDFALSGRTVCVPVAGRTLVGDGGASRRRCRRLRPAGRRVPRRSAPASPG